MRLHDVAIIGGGPAGASAATLLGREGFDVAVFDRARFPRDKACGEFINPGACELLDSHLGISRDELREIGAAEVSEVSFRAGSEPPVDVTLLDAEGRTRPGLSMRRTDFDARLLQGAREAGASVYEAFNVRGVLTESGQACGVAGVGPGGEPFECRSRLVIACDGTHSVAARQFALCRPIPRLQRIGVVAHFAGVAEACRSVVMYAASGREGGVAGFSVQPGNRAVLSCVVPLSASRMLAGRLREFVSTRLEHFSGLGDFLGGAELEGPVRTVPCHGHSLPRASLPGLLIVGDAARFVDPFTGEGIHHAIQGAVFAAETAAAALRAGDVGGRRLAAYDGMRAELSRRYLLCDLVQAIVHRGPVAMWGARQLRLRPELAARLIGVLGDLLPPRDLLRLRYLRSGAVA